MIELKAGSLLDADAEALVNTVNCVGVMGKGIALQFKQAFPDNFQQYAKACRAKNVKLGQMFVVDTHQLVNPKYIINFPTKNHWKGKSRLEDIRRGMQDLVKEIKVRGIRSVAVPPLGCGNGGLEWSDVAPIITGALTSIPDVHVFLFEPHGAPDADSMPVATDKPRMTPTRALLIKLLEAYLRPGYRLTLSEIQKLAYFLQTAGEPLRLEFVKHRYGPYAEKLNHVLQRIEGHYIRGYGDRSGHAGITLLPKATDIAEEYLWNDPDVVKRLDKVHRLIEGFESPYGLELLASVHWVAKENPEIASDLSKITDRVYAWSKRKQQLFKTRHIDKAWHRLQDEGWLIQPTQNSNGTHKG
jgi:O-acetyl-ADP-ribose deacetylase (regulator of RNase III)